MKVGCHAVVVGGTKGLGRAIVERFLERGCVVTVVSRNPPADMTIASRINHLPLDLETLRDGTEVVEQIVGLGGPLRYLVFSQRYRGQGDPWAGELQVSVTATDLLIRASAPAFVGQLDKGGGIESVAPERGGAVDLAIVVVSSVYAKFVGGSQPVSYHVAKAGLNQLVKYYAWTLGARGIRVNAVMPLTFQKQESRDHYMANRPLMELYRRLVPLGRMGTSSDSANVIEFLCSDKASFLTGQSILVDGGVSLVWPEEIARRFAGI